MERLNVRAGQVIEPVAHLAQALLLHQPGSRAETEAEM